MKYEFTMTLRPVMYKFTAREQFIKTKDIINNMFFGFATSIVAELTKENNIHYHAIVEIKSADDRNKLLDRSRGSMIWGRKSCSQLVNEPKWITYILKDIVSTREIIKDHPLIRDDLEIEDYVYKFNKDLSIRNAICLPTPEFRFRKP